MSDSECYFHSQNDLITISWSGLKRYEECRQRHLRHKQGRASPSSDARVFLEGTVADLAMRQWLLNPEGSLVESATEIMRALVDPQTEEEKANRDQRPIKWKGNPVEDRKKAADKVRRCLEQLEPFLREYVLPYDYMPELRFKVPVRIPNLSGTGHMWIRLNSGIDIVTRHPDGNFHNFDLKTTENDQYVRKTLGQSVFYDISFGHWIGDSSQPKSFAFVFPLLKRQIVPVNVTNKERMALMQRVVSMAHSIARDEWQPKEDDAGCQWCDCRHACDKFKLDVTQESGKNLASFEAAAARRRT